MNRSTIAPIALLGLALTGAAPSETGAEAQLRTIAEKMRGIHTLQVTMHQRKEMAVFGDAIEADGELLLVRPRRLRMDLRGPGGTTLIIDGNRMTMHYPGLGKTERFDLARDRRAQAIADHLFLLLDADPDALREIYALELAGEAPLTVRLTPIPEALRKVIASVDIRFDARGFVDELALRDGSGDRTLWTFHEPRVNGTVDSSRFVMD